MDLVRLVICIFCGKRGMNLRIRDDWSRLCQPTAGLDICLSLCSVGSSGERWKVGDWKELPHIPRVGHIVGAIRTQTA